MNRYLTARGELLDNGTDWSVPFCALRRRRTLDRRRTTSHAPITLAGLRVAVADPRYDRRLQPCPDAGAFGATTAGRVRHQGGHGERHRLRGVQRAVGGGLHR